MKQRNHMLDLLKGICILLVVATHFEWTDQEELILGFPFWLRMAVPVFMMISAWLYTANFEKRQVAYIEDALTFDYVVKNALRYTLPFFVVYIVEMIIYIVENIISDEELSFAVMALRFFRGGWGPGSYYYPVMIQFIFVCPIIYGVIRRYRIKGVCIAFLTNFFFEILKEALFIEENTYRLLIFRYIFVIACGCYLSMDKEKFKPNMWWMSLVGGIYIIAVSYLGYDPTILHFWEKTSMMSSLFIVPVFAYLVKCHGTVRCKPLEFLGRASYNIFLAQMVYYRYVEEFVISAVDQRWLVFVIDMVVSVVLGLLFYGVEPKWTQKWIQKALQWHSRKKEEKREKTTAV